MASNFLQDLISSLLERTPKFGAVNDTRSIEELCEALLAATGENSIKGLSATILERYQTLDGEGKLAFFQMLADRLDVDADRILEVAKSYKENRNAATLETLLKVAEPTRQELLRRLNHVPGATQALVRMRSDLLKFTRDSEPLKRVDLDFAHLFSSWFNRGFLVEDRINWDSSASVLAKIIQYEAVHAINDWDDLRRRIQPPDRRCFAFFHPSMPNEPLVFVEVALSKGIPGSVQDLLREERTPINPVEADTAVFYSISNCQSGLRGISFGNSLIKQVATDLARELPQLTTFVTLSPLPGFADWLRTNPALESTGVAQALESSIADFKTSHDPKDLAVWDDALVHLGAKYLCQEKRNNGSPLDPVARFHLNNGASLHNIHAWADISEKGLENSFGLMVNYHYDLKKVEAFHEDFASSGKVQASKTIAALSEQSTDQLIPSQTKPVQPPISKKAIK